jgi:MFS family permease
MMARTDGLLLVNAIVGRSLSSFASRIFIVSLPTMASALNADILGISWALIAYQLAGISLSVVFGRLGIPDATPSVDNPSAFGSATNATCLVCAAFLFGALLASLMRGRTSIEAPVAERAGSSLGCNGGHNV